MSPWGNPHHARVAKCPGASVRSVAGGRHGSLASLVLSDRGFLLQFVGLLSVAYSLIHPARVVFFSQGKDAAAMNYGVALSRALGDSHWKSSAVRPDIATGGSSCGGSNLRSVVARECNID